MKMSMPWTRTSLWIKMRYQNPRQRPRVMEMTSSSITSMIMTMMKACLVSFQKSDRLAPLSLYAMHKTVFQLSPCLVPC